MDKGKKIHYFSHYVATVRFVNDHEFVVVGGMAGKKALKQAKKETDFCYVKDLASKSEVKLTLVKNAWIKQ